MGDHYHYAPIDLKTTYAIVNDLDRVVAAPFHHEELARRAFDVLKASKQLDRQRLWGSDRLRLVKWDDLDTENVPDFPARELKLKREMLKRAITHPNLFDEDCHARVYAYRAAWFHINDVEDRLTLHRARSGRRALLMRVLLRPALRPSPDRTGTRRRGDRLGPCRRSGSNQTDRPAKGRACAQRDPRPPQWRVGCCPLRPARRRPRAGR
jgi:hypothetical protein